MLELNKIKSEMLPIAEKKPVNEDMIHKMQYK